MAAQGQGQKGMDPAVLDEIIRRLLEVRFSRPGKQVQLSVSEIRQLCVASREIFIHEPNLLELEAPIKICGILSVSLSPSCLVGFCNSALILWFAEWNINSPDFHFLLFS
ncbi:hypothetical protein Ancab_040029 [Ancistrocladus abbreviatus]